MFEFRVKSKLSFRRTRLTGNAILSSSVVIMYLNWIELSTCVWNFLIQYDLIVKLIKFIVSRTTHSLRFIMEILGIHLPFTDPLFTENAKPKLANDALAGRKTWKGSPHTNKLFLFTGPNLLSRSVALRFGFNNVRQIRQWGCFDGWFRVARINV